MLHHWLRSQKGFNTRWQQAFRMENFQTFKNRY